MAIPDRALAGDMSAALMAEVFEDGVKAIERKIAELRAAHRSEVHARLAYRSAMLELERLSGEAGRYIDQAAFDGYRSGWDRAFDSTLYATPREVGARVQWQNFAKVNTAAIEQITYAARRSADAAFLQVGRRIEDIYRQRGLQAAANQMFTGESLREAKRRAARDLLARTGSPHFVDVAGRHWKLDSYCSMVLRTTPREAYTTATRVRGEAGGFKLYHLSEHHPTCELCAPLQGLVYTTDQDDRRYELWRDDYCPVHPNCIHVASIYIPDYDSKRDQRQTGRGNRDLEADPRSRREKAAYDATQRENARLAALRNQHSRYYSRLGKDAGSIQSFARKKRAGGQAWKDLQAKYRAAGQPITG